MELKRFFAKGAATFINRPATLVNNDLKKVLYRSAFFNFVFCLAVSNNSRGRSFPSNILKIVLKVVSVLFLTALFSFSSFVFVSFTFTLLF